MNRYRREMRVEWVYNGENWRVVGLMKKAGTDCLDRAKSSQKSVIVLGQMGLHRNKLAHEQSKVGQQFMILQTVSIDSN